MRRDDSCRFFGFDVEGPGLVPELLCSTSSYRHAGTTDVDVQVDLEIAGGSISAARLERALRNADFVPDDEHVWRWVAEGLESPAMVKFELLADLDDQPDGSTLVFDGCERLGAANLRGTGFAARDLEVRELRAKIGGVMNVAEVNVSGLAGFLLAKSHAARSRRRQKDWYDIAFVLLHNDAGGPEAAVVAVRDRFRDDISGSTRSAIGISRRTSPLPARRVRWHTSSRCSSTIPTSSERSSRPTRS